MIHLEFPSGEKITLHSAVFDYNGTLAWDGHLEEGVAHRLSSLSEKLNIYILTADTFGLSATECRELPVSLKVVSQTDGMSDKCAFVEELGENGVVCIGNGVNDSLMMARCALGIAVIGREGCAIKTLTAADVVVSDVRDAIDLLLNPKRLIATLRP